MRRAASPVGLTTVMCLAQIAGMAGFATFLALLPDFISLWQLSNTEAGWINGVFYIGYMLAVPILVSLTDRLHPKHAYFFASAVTALSSLCFALADGFWSALILRTLAGIGLAGTYMPGLKLLTDHIGGRAQSRAIAFYTSAFGVGASLSIVLAGEIEARLDWQATFALMALGPVVAVLLIQFLVPPDDPRSHPAPSTHLLDFRPVLRCRAAMAYVVAYAVHNLELFAVRGWIVTYLVFAESTHPEPRPVWWSATVLAAIFNLFGVPSSILGNEIAQRFGQYRTIAATMILSGIAAVAVGLAVNEALWLVVVACAVHATFIGGESAAVTAGAIANAPEGYKGATMAVHSTLGFVGSFLGPLAFGVVLDLNGSGETLASWHGAFAAIGLAMLAGPIAILWLGRPAAAKPESAP